MSLYVSLLINCCSGYLTDGCCSMQAEAMVLFSQFSSFPEPEPDMVAVSCRCVTPNFYTYNCYVSLLA
jgi:hypothetical protein